MSTRALVRQYSTAVDDVTRLATRDVVDLWHLADPTDARATTDLFLGHTTDLVQAYGDVSATAGTDLYDQLRELAGVPGKYRALPADVPAASKTEAMTRWAVGPLWGEPDYGQALANLAGGVDRLIRLPFRDTVSGNSRSDPESHGLYRYASPGCCSFCSELSGLVRYADDNAESASAEWHMSCRCVPGPSFGPADIGELGDDQQDAGTDQQDAGYDPESWDSDKVSTERRKDVEEWFADNVTGPMDEDEGMIADPDRLREWKGHSNEIGDHLRYGEKATDATRDAIRGMDDMFAEGSWRTTSDVVVYRGAGGGFDAAVGELFTDNGFVATSLSRDTAWGFSGGNTPTIVEIFVPQGTRALPVSVREAELLLNRGSTFRVVAIDFDGKTKIVRCVLVS